MPISVLTEQAVVVVCAKCKTSRTLPLVTLEVGVVYGEQRVDPAMIAVPGECCGSREFFARTWDIDTSSTPRAQHRRAVNTLGELLKRRGRVRAECRDVVASEARPKDTASVPCVVPPL